MYCTGFGDCFLIAFGRKNKSPAFVWIDCGALPHQSVPQGWLKRIVTHIKETVKSAGGIRLLIVTHKHLDHLSGFHDAREIFQEIPVHEVWMPWTENPRDKQAMGLAARESEMLQVAHLALTHLDQIDGTLRANAQEVATNVTSLLEFAGLGAVGVSVESMLDIVRKKKAPEYLTASLTPRTLPDLPDLRVHVLGPPDDCPFLRRMDPSKGEKREVYLAGVDLNATRAIGAALKKTTASRDKEIQELSSPFNNELRRPAADVKKKSEAEDPSPLAKLAKTYYGSTANDPQTVWRQIEHNWLGAAVQLALKSDSFRNNTSLALAFELGDGGPVLLFPGDAQVGNWLSWHERKPGNGPTATELLARTVFYKAGHHGSENATLKELGLELMARAPQCQNQLVVMVPTSQVVAKSKTSKRNPDGWDIPWQKLLDRLKAAAGGRVIRIDEAKDWHDRLQSTQEPSGVEPTSWQWFRAQTSVLIDPEHERPLFVEFSVKKGSRSDA